jgi:1-aminocyclopropane-1-carboxylate deaminase
MKAVNNMNSVSSHADFARLQSVDEPFVSSSNVQLSVLRLDDFILPQSGNKYFKLKLNIESAKAQRCNQLVSFGGAYSNHIHALALAGRHHGIPTLGVIRGEPTIPLNPALQDAVNAGMKLVYVSREEYRQKDTPEYLSRLKKSYPQAYIIPEGGSNLLGVRGCMEIVDHIEHHLGDQYDMVALPCGTAATLAGVSAAVSNDKKVLGFSVLKNAHHLDQQVRDYHFQLGCVDKKNWRIEHGFHCGGYAKINQELVQFMNYFSEKTSILIDPIYTAKMFFGLQHLLHPDAVHKGVIKTETKRLRIVAIHTGGLQGARGMQSKIKKLNDDLKSKARLK